MVDFNGFDKGVIGRKLPADTTLNNMRKMDLVKLLHLAEDNHRVLAEAYKIAVDNSKCDICPFNLDIRKAKEIRADEIRAEERKKVISEMLSKLKPCVNESIRTLGVSHVFDMVEILKEYEKETKHEKY